MLHIYHDIIPSDYFPSCAFYSSLLQRMMTIFSHSLIV